MKQSAVTRSRRPRRSAHREDDLSNSIALSACHFRFDTKKDTTEDFSFKVGFGSCGSAYQLEPTDGI